jgi:Tfp pilus assembly protein PilO
MKLGLRIYIFFALLVAIPIGAYVVVFEPNQAKAQKMEREIDAKAKNLDKVSQASANIQQLEKEISTLAKAMAYFRGKLPNQRQIPAIVEEISVLVKENELKLVSISPVSKTGIQYVQDQHYAEQAIEIKLEGDYMTFYAFLQDLEKLPRITRIQNLLVSGRTLPEVKSYEDAVQAGRDTSNLKPPGHVGVKFVVSIFYDKNPSQD